MSFDDNRSLSSGYNLPCSLDQDTRSHLQPAYSQTAGYSSSQYGGNRSRKSSSSRGRAPLACNDDGFDEVEELFLRTDSNLDGEYGNGISGMTPQPSPLPGSSRSVSPGLRYRNLGKSGLRVSNIGLATWMLSSEDMDTAEAIITLAYEGGINVFDLSEAYSGPEAEIMMGKILKKKKWKRTSYVVLVKIYWTSKCEERGLSRKYILDCVKASLERLQLDFIDVLIIHRADPMCPMEELVRAMSQCITNGWAMYWGTSKWTPVEIMEAYSNCRQFNCITPIVEQAEYHFFCRDKPELYMTELYNKIGVGLMTWSPLTMSFYKALGKNQEDSLALVFRSSLKKRERYLSSYSWNEDETSIMAKESWNKERSASAEEATAAKQLHQQKLSRELSALAEKHGCSLAQLVVAWCLKNDPVQCMLVGPTSTPELLNYFQALQLIPKLSTPVMSELEKILDNRPVRPPMVSTLAMAQR